MEKILPFIFFLLFQGCTIHRIPYSGPGPDNPLLPDVVKPLPEGWVLNGVLAAAWGSDLSGFIQSTPDTSFGISFWEELYDIEDADPVLIPRATITYSYNSGVTQEDYTLEYINIHYLINPTDLNDDDYVLAEVKRSIFLVDTAPIQLTSNDVVKQKILMVYGTPTEFDGLSYRYYNDITDMKIQEIDDRHLIVHLKSIDSIKQLANVLETYYSNDAREKQKRSLLDKIDL